MWCEMGNESYLKGHVPQCFLEFSHFFSSTSLGVAYAICTALFKLFCRSLIALLRERSKSDMGGVASFACAKYDDAIVKQKGRQ